MTVEEVMKQARARGATFQVLEKTRLKVHASSPLPDAMMEELRQHEAFLRGRFAMPGPMASRL